jgi:hypothetical protein
VINDDEADAREVAIQVPGSSEGDTSWQGQMVTSGVFNESMEPVYARDEVIRLTVPPLTLISLRA